MEVRVPSDRSLFPSNLSLTQDPARWPWRLIPPGAPRAFPAARFRKNGTGLRLKAHEDSRLAAGLFDTFDWGILRAGAMLLEVHRAGQGSGELVLISRETGKPKAASKAKSELAQDAGPDGRLGWFGKRAVLPIGNAELLAERFRILDGNDKQVGWLDRLALMTEDSSAPEVAASPRGWLRVLPLRGFDRVLEGVLNDAELAKPEDLVGALAAKHDRAPLDYPVDQAAGMSPGTPIRVGIPRMLGALRRTAEANQPYLIDPPDVEFLHDYRVAMRRMRTLARVLERCGIAGWFGVRAAPLKAWMAVTSPARDIDVFRQDVSALEADLPSRLAASMQPLEASLAREQTVAYDAIAQQLRTGIPPWREWRIDRPAIPEREPADRQPRFAPDDPMEELASWAIRRERKRFEKALAHVRSQVDEPPDSLDTMLHKLRIRVKRYRYAVDLFGVALAKGGGKPKELKRLQDRLGAFHDLVVRRRRLEEYVEPGPHAATVQDLAAHAAAAGALFLVTDSDLAKQRQRLLEELRR